MKKQREKTIVVGIVRLGSSDSQTGRVYFTFLALLTSFNNNNNKNEKALFIKPDTEFKMLSSPCK